jgi:hypothetical protein
LSSVKFIERLLMAEGRRGEVVALEQRHVGVPSEMIAQFRQSPMWPALEAGAQSLACDATIVQDVERGDPSALRKYAGVSVPTLIMDGTVLLGSAQNHGWMRRGADELARVVPGAQRCTLEGQDHGPADEVLAAALSTWDIHDRLQVSDVAENQGNKGDWFFAGHRRRAAGRSSPGGRRRQEESGSRPDAPLRR